MAALRKGHSQGREHKGVRVTEVVEDVTKVPIMEAVWEDDVQVGEKRVGTAVHVHFRIEWPDGSVTHGTASEERFRKRAEG